MSLITQCLCRLKRNVNSAKQFYALHIFVQKASYAENVAASENISENSDKSEKEKIRLQRIRNISGLNTMNYRKLHGIMPYVTGKWDAHQKTLRWQRRQIGLYGTNNTFDPALCFITKEEMADLNDYEKVAFDKSITQIRNEALQKLAEEKEERRLREERVVENLKKNVVWKREIRDRMAKKKTEVSDAKKKRQRLLEEVRRHFGYMIDTRDEKFQIMLEVKEAEQRKLSKLAKKKKKEEIFLSKLAALEVKSNKSSENSSDSMKTDPDSKTEGASS